MILRRLVATAALALSTSAAMAAPDAAKVAQKLVWPEQNAYVQADERNSISCRHTKLGLASPRWGEAALR